MRNTARAWLIGGWLLGIAVANSAPAAPPAAARPGGAPRPAAAPANPTSGATAGDERVVAAPSGTSQEYILGPADVIEVSVLGRPDFDVKDRIGADGTIRTPYLGAVKVADKTIKQFADELGKALETGGYYAHPIVKVDILSYASRYVTVLGNFGTPGLIPVDRAYRLSEIVARVGGVRETGAPYVIFTPARGEQRRIFVRDLATGDLNGDPYVSPGDKIYSPEAELFYVSGQVKSPGAFGILPELTFRMALSRAGGVTDSGSDKNISVTRGTKTLKHVDLDTKVMPGDVILVPERLF
ncbi:MAG: sugar transporter substrate-binding protein [Caulobacteraceae bacterium]|nr:sugar transporter substrate-binding protein [Caulobacteraceae bacterium]